MEPENLVGLRHTDLSTDEQAAQATMLADSADRAAEHRAALGLSDRLQQLPVQRPPLRPATRSRAPVVALGGTLLAAAAALLVAVLPTGERDRAVSGSSLGAIQLSAAAEGPLGLRPLASGAAVGHDEWVVFQVQTEGGGALTLTEHAERSRSRVYPRSGEWSVQAGAHLPGDGSPVAWRPDDGAGLRRYVAELCVDGPEAGCVSDTLELRWSE